jgi:surface antigen
LPTEIDADGTASLTDLPAKLTMPGLTGSQPKPTYPASSSIEVSQHFAATTGNKKAPPPTTRCVPVIIPGTGKRPVPAATHPVKITHRVAMHASVVGLLIVFVLTTLMTFLPVGKDGQALGMSGLLQNLGVMHMAPSSAKNTALLDAQAATATAVTVDGYDGGANNVQYNNLLGAPTNSSDVAQLNRFIYGQCTYWTNMRYHQLTGYWVTWSGNAYQWAYNAYAYSPPWTISSKPNPKGPSIMVFAPGVQYANPVYGHVAIVEHSNADGSLTTSNWNVSGYPFATRVDLTNYVTAGTTFIWHL